MRSLIAIGFVASFIAIFQLLSFCSLHRAYARDDGRFANSPLKTWFDQLASKKGLCCSFADGVKVENVDWQTTPDGQHYQVRLDGKWIDVPDAAVVTDPNRFGPAVVWPYRDVMDGSTQIRCFLPGAGA